MRVSEAARSYAPFFLLAFALSVGILLTDRNLRTSFGPVSHGDYTLLYVLLVTALADLVAASLLLFAPVRRAILGGTAGAGLQVLVLTGDILAYREVGFATAADFARYLFGVTYYGGDVRYLYDVLLTVYLVTFVAGLVFLTIGRRSTGVVPPAEPTA
jgi:hypothetical protein